MDETSLVKTLNNIKKASKHAASYLKPEKAKQKEWQKSKEQQCPHLPKPHRRNPEQNRICNKFTSRRNYQHNFLCSSLET